MRRRTAGGWSLCGSDGRLRGRRRALEYAPSSFGRPVPRRRHPLAGRRGAHGEQRAGAAVMGHVGGGVDAAVGGGALQVPASAQTVGFGLGDVSLTAAPATTTEIVPLVIAVSAAGRRAGEGVTARVRVRALGLRQTGNAQIRNRKD